MKRWDGVAQTLSLLSRCNLIRRAGIGDGKTYRGATKNRHARLTPVSTVPLMSYSGWSHFTVSSPSLSTQTHAKWEQLKTTQITSKSHCGGVPCSGVLPNKETRPHKSHLAVTSMLHTSKTKRQNTVPPSSSAHSTPTLFSLNMHKATESSYKCLSLFLELLKLWTWFFSPALDRDLDAWNISPSVNLSEFKDGMRAAVSVIEKIDNECPKTKCVVESPSYHEPSPFN